LRTITGLVYKERVSPSCKETDLAEGNNRRASGYVTALKRSIRKEGRTNLILEMSSELPRPEGRGVYLTL